MKLLFVIFVSIITAVGAFAQAEPPAPPAIEEIYLAKDDGNGKAGEQVTEFRTTDVPIYCVILLESNTKTVVKMNFVALRVSGVKPETKVVTVSYTTADGQNRVNFSGRPEGKWTAGKYRVDLFLNGTLAKNVEFEIKDVPGNNVAVKYLAPPVNTKPKPVKPKDKNEP